MQIEFPNLKDFFVFMLKKVKIFLVQVKEELKKVNWTKREELLASTSVVVITVIILCIYIGIVDFALKRFISFVLK